MDATALGPYRILREIGSGGMGTVHLAEVVGEPAGAPIGTRVAIKLVHPRLLERRGTLSRFRREAEIGQRIDHENVVRTLDVGTVETGGETHHYLVMEYVEGRTLRTLLEDLGEVPEALLREIARQAASGLAAIHAHDVVHRDLKPENVLITEDHRVRIMDLGVARLAVESATLTQEGEFAGSLAYAAPELFRAEPATHLADLYALGITLYELATGENPFLRDESAQVIAAQMNEEPRPLSDVAPDSTPFLGEVLRTLLAKEPAKRFAGAKELSEVLAQGERSPWWGAREQRLLALAGGLPAVPVRRETKVYGRETERDLLRAKWRDAREGRGGGVLLVGEAGIGKTRLVDLFLSELAGQDAHVLYGSYPPSGGLGGLSQAILDHFGVSGLESSLAPYLRVTPRLVPAFASLVKHESPPEGAEPVRGDALHTVFCHLLHALAAERPVVWVVDDLHFASPDSRKIVLSMARAVRNHPVLLVLTTRPGLPEEELLHFGGVEGLARGDLGRISPREVVELLRDAFRSEALADQLGAQIAYKSDGVPFFVFEMIRGLREGNFIHRQADGSFVATRLIERIEVPSAVRDLVTARVAGLSEEERAILDVGAVQGYGFRADLVATVRGMQRLVVLERLASLERRTGVIRSGAEGYRFDHHQIQEVLYGDVPVELCSEYHSAIAEAMAAATPADAPGETAWSIAAHHLRGSRPAGALHWFDRALEHLDSAWRNEEAIDLATRALAAPGLLDGPRRAEVLLRHTERLHQAGRFEEEGRVLEETALLVDRIGDQALKARAKNRVAALYTATSRLDPAEADLTEAVALAREAGDRRVLAEALALLGNVHWSRDDFERARDRYEEAMAIAREAGDRRREGHTLGSLGNVALALGRQEEARGFYEQAVALVRDLGDRQLEGWIRGNLGSVYWNLGRIAEARDEYQQSLDIAREVGDRNVEGTAVGNLGRSFDFLGRYAEALEQLGRRIAMARETGSVRGEAIALLNIASLRLRLGDADGAEQALEEAERQVTEIGAPGLKAYVHVSRATVEELRGNPGAALEQLDRARRLREEVADAAGAASTLGARAKIFLGEGRDDEAREELEQSLSMLPGEGAGGQLVLATTLLAVLGRRPFAEAREIFARWEDRLDVATRMEARFLLWRAGGEPEDLSAARGLLRHLIANAPEADRDRMARGVLLHREILAAGEQEGK